MDLKRFGDDGGSFTELRRLSAGNHGAFPGFECKQINYSEMDPGVIKAFHIIYLVDTHFQADPDHCDEGRLPWDFAGAAIWDVAKG